MGQNPSFDDLLGTWPFTGPASMPTTDPSWWSMGQLAASPAHPAISGVLGASFDAGSAGGPISAEPAFPGQDGFGSQNPFRLSALNSFLAPSSPGVSRRPPTGLLAAQPQTALGVLGAFDPSEASNPWSPSGLAPSATQPATPLAITRFASHVPGPFGTAVDPTHIPGLPVAAASGFPQTGAGGFRPSPILTAVNAAIASGREALTPSPDKSSLVVHPWNHDYIYSPTGRFHVSINDGSPPGNEMEPSGVKNPQTGEPVEATVPVLGETDISLTNISAPYAPFFGSQALGNTGLFTTRPTVGYRLPSPGGDITLTNPSGAGWYFVSNTNPLYQDGADIKVEPLPGKMGAGR
jgi:hypothetical protein